VNTTSQAYDHFDHVASRDKENCSIREEFELCLTAQNTFTYSFQGKSELHSIALLINNGDVRTTSASRTRLTFH
jgi:hypothetical protein